MPIPFSPQLIGETEKTLNALLRRLLEGTGLTEPDWVTLRVADEFDGRVDATGLAEAVADRAHFPDAVERVAELSHRDLLADGRMTAAGRELVASVQARIATETAPIWRDLPADDVASAARVLNEIVSRARLVLSSMPA